MYQGNFHFSRGIYELPISRFDPCHLFFVYYIIYTLLLINIHSLQVDSECSPSVRCSSHTLSPPPQRIMTAKKLRHANGGRKLLRLSRHNPRNTAILCYRGSVYYTTNIRVDRGKSAELHCNVVLFKISSVLAFLNLRKEMKEEGWRGRRLEIFYVDQVKMYFNCFKMI